MVAKIFSLEKDFVLGGAVIFPSVPGFPGYLIRSKPDYFDSPKLKTDIFSVIRSEDFRWLE